MPTKDGVGGDERSNLGEGASSNSLASHGQSASLVVGQPESSAAELLLQEPILLAEILDDRILLTGDPAGQGGDEDLPRSQPSEASASTSDSLTSGAARHHGSCTRYQ